MPSSLGLELDLEGCAARPLFLMVVLGRDQVLHLLLRGFALAVGATLVGNAADVHAVWLVEDLCIRTQGAILRLPGVGSSMSTADRGHMPTVGEVVEHGLLWGSAGAHIAAVMAALILEDVGLRASSARAVGLLLLGARFHARMAVRYPCKVLLVTTTSRDERALHLPRLEDVELPLHFGHLTVRVAEAYPTRGHDLRAGRLHALLDGRLRFTDVKALIELVDCARHRLALPSSAFPAAKVERIVERVALRSIVG